MYRLDYSSNNSGGSWWLKDKDWHALEAAGWSVDWYNPEDVYDHDPRVKRYPDGRFLGALASRASRQVDSKDAAMAALEEFESLTGANIDDEGCNCCGQPHYFTLYREVPCDKCDDHRNEFRSECLWCEGSGLMDDYVSSYDSGPKTIQRGGF